MRLSSVTATITIATSPCSTAGSRPAGAGSRGVLSPRSSSCRGHAPVPTTPRASPSPSSRRTCATAACAARSATTRSSAPVAHCSPANASAGAATARSLSRATSTSSYGAGRRSAGARPCSSGTGAASTCSRRCVMAGRPTKLSPEVHRNIVAFIRAGAYSWVAAEAAGVSKTTFHRWLQRGAEEPRGRYREFADDVRQAQAQARVAAETEVRRTSPVSWLRYGPGRERPGEPGWTEQHEVTVEVGTAEEALRAVQGMTTEQLVVLAGDCPHCGG